MAARTDLEQLVFSLSADVSQMNKAMDKALGIVKANTKKINEEMEQGGNNAGKSLAKGVHGGTAGMLGNARIQMMELQHIFRSAADSIASGQNPMRVFAQEGGRIAQVLSNGGLGGVLSSITSMLNPMAVGLAAVGVAMYAVSSAAISFDAEQRKVVIGLLGTAAASGMTVQSLEEITNAADKLNHQSAVATRGMALMFAGHGVEGVDNIKAATSIVEDLAVSLGIKVPAAAELLAKALQHPEQGVKSLNEVVHGFVSGDQMHMIVQLEATGHHLEAQKLLIDALSGSISGNADHLSAWSKAWRDFGVELSKEGEGIGRFFAKLAGYRDAGDIAPLQAKKLAIQRQLNSKDLRPWDRDALQHQMNDVNGQLNPLLADQAKEKARSDAAQANVDSQHLQDIKDRADPKRAQIERLEADVTRLKQAIADDAKAGKNTDEDKRYLAGAEANLARAKRRETHMVGSGKGSDDTDAKNKLAADAEVIARQNLARAIAQQEKDIAVHSAAEIAAVKAEYDVRAQKVAEDKKAIDDDKNNHGDKSAQKAKLDHALAIDRQTAIVKTQTQIDALALERKANAERLADEVMRSQASLLQDQLASVKTQAERRVIQHQLLEAERMELAVKLENARSAALKADPANAASINAGFDKRRDNLIAQFNLKGQSADDKTMTPFQKWADDAKKSSAEVHEALESYAVKGMDDFNSGVAEAIVHGKDLGQTMRSIFQSMEADLVRYLMKQAEISLLGDGAGQSGLLHAAGIPFFASGTNSAPGGMAVVGENGPELVNLPRGAQVIPNHAIRNASSGGGLRGGSAMGGSTSISLHSTYDLTGAVTSQEVKSMIVQSHQLAVSRAVDIAKRGAQASANSDYLLSR